MKKKIIMIAAAVVVIVGSVVALHFVREIDISPPPPEMPEQIFILGAPPATVLVGETGEEVLGPMPIVDTGVRSVLVTNSYGSFTVWNTGDEHIASNFMLEGFEDVDVNRSGIIGIANRAQRLNASRVIEEPGANLADFGLLPPSATADIVYLSGSTARLLIGNEAPGGNIYVMREGSDTIYLVTRANLNHFLQRDVDFVRTAITPAGPEGVILFSRAVLGGSERTIIVEETEPEEGRMFGSHTMTYPTNDRLNHSSVEMLMSAFGLVANSVEAKFDSLDELYKWGLDEPFSTLEIESEEFGIFNLIASSPGSAGPGMVYLVRLGVPIVYRVNVSALPWLEVTSFEMMDRMIILPFIDSISTLTVHTADPYQTLVFHLEGEGHDLEVTFNGEQLEDMRQFRQLFQSLIAASFESETEEEIPENANLVMQFIYEYRDGRPSDVVSFYEGAARRLFVQLNDGPPMLGLTVYLDLVVANIGRFLAGEPVIIMFF